MIFGRIAPRIGVLLTLVASAARGATPLDYSRDIEPILSDACYHCHGPDARQRKADLRLDRLDSTLAPHDGHTALVPGHPEKSELLTRILSSDPDEKMPPPKSDRRLTPEQVQTLKWWVEAGAVWGKHWAYEPPRRPEVPEVKDAGWCRNPIDRFILARLEQEGLRPSPEASKENLIRRVSFDLTGLPPTDKEIDDFLADRSPDAYEKVVDRLLASPHYGEKWAREWLDAARYSDTNGYQEDRTRTAWPWRDWVVRSMNENLPFDRFVVQQIAGDLLPDATPEQKLATFFNRSHMLNGEGGALPEESRFNYVIDRVNTTSTVFLGLTFNCCQCHDHKYDPFTQKEYYQLFSYFNNLPESGTVDAGGNANPVMRLASDADTKALAALDEKVKSDEAALAAAAPSIDAEQKAWEALQSAAVTWTVVTPRAVESKNGASLAIRPDGSILATGVAPQTDVQEVVLRTNLTGVRALRLEALPDDSLPHGGPGRADENGNFVLTTLEGEAVSLADTAQRMPLSFGSADATYSQEGWDVKGAIDADPKTGWAVWHAPDPKNLIATFTLAEPVGFASGAEMRLRLHFESPYPKHSLGHYRLSLTAGTPAPAAIASVLVIPAEKRSDAQKNEVARFYREHASPRFRSLSDAVASAKKGKGDYESRLPQVMVMSDAQPRQTHVMIRGSYDKPGDAVSPGVPAELSPMPAGAPNNRLGLAQWMVDKSNPLLARVTVNRYWQSLFGIGIVKTVEDFGVQGEKPSHPQLLDWLACECESSGWNVKAIQRLMVTSAAYRQSSRVSPELLDRDPDNRLLARGPRHRLTSFALRDQALAASGLLNDRVGGEPVFPYQPPNLWEEFSFGKIHYTQDHGDKLYRRSLYVFWRRTVPPTMMFDSASRQVCTVRQTRTNTPLQALILMDETGYVEAGRVLAQKLLEDPSLSDEQRITEMFRRCTARKPTDREMGILLATLHKLQGQYRQNKDDAMKLIATGEYPRDDKLDPINLAAYTALDGTIMNLDESLTNE